MILKMVLPAIAMMTLFIIASTEARIARSASAANCTAESESDYSGNSKYACEAKGPINLFTGSAAYTFNLASIKSKSGLSYEMVMNYSGVMAGCQVLKNNSLAPTGIAGLGWNLCSEAIIVDSKNTADINDDEYFIKAQNGEVSQIIRSGGDIDSCVYYVKNQPFWKIKATLSIPNSNGWQAITKWVVTYPDGTQYSYGGTDNSNRRVQVDENGNFDPKKHGNEFVYQWDLQFIKDAHNGVIIFSYEPRYEYWDEDLVVENPGESHAFAADYGWGNLWLPSDHFPRIISPYWNAIAELIQDGNSWYECDNGYLCKANEPYPTEPETKVKGVIPGNFDSMWIDKRWEGHWYFLPAWGPTWHFYVTTTSFKNIAGQNCRSSKLRSIESDNGDVITFSWGAKKSNELGTRTILEDACYLSCISIKKGNVTENIQLMYSGPQSEGSVTIPHLNSETSYEKRMLRGIKTIEGTGYINRMFEYDNFTGLLVKIIEPMIGKSIVYKYKLHNVSGVNGKKYGVQVVDTIVQNAGITSNPENIINYTYTTNPNKQMIDNSGIVYFGEVQLSSTAGTTVYNFETNEKDNLFGVIKSVENLSSKSKSVLKEQFNYVAKAFGPADNPFYVPILNKTESTKFGVTTRMGICDSKIDINNGLPKQSWTIGPNGDALVTENVYAYEKYPAMNGVGKNMLTQIAQIKIFHCPAFNETTGELGMGAKVVKASYTTWNLLESGTYAPHANYMWVYENSAGIEIAYFKDFDSNAPLANDWKKINTIDMYDIYCNVLQTSNVNGVSNSIILNNANRLPIAKIENAKYGECYFTSFEEDAIWRYNDGKEKKIKRSTVYAKNGSFSGLIENNTGEEIYAESPWRQLEDGLVNKKSFTFSGWVFSTGPDVELFFFASTKGKTYENENYTSIQLPANEKNKWFFLQGTFEASIGAKYFMMRICNNGMDGPNTEIYFDDLKFYPSNANMNTTYYDFKWGSPVMSIDANDNPSNLIKLDSFGRPEKIFKIDKTLSSNDTNGYMLLSQKKYHLIGQDVQILRPNGGERLTPGQKIEINWSGPINVEPSGINLYFFNGSIWSSNPINGAATIVEKNSFIWTVPVGSEFDGCLIKIVDASTSIELDRSNETFTISNYLAVTSPAKNTTWWTGKTDALPWNLQTIPIRWVANGGSDFNVRIEYWNGKMWEQIVENTQNDGEYDWKTIKGESCVGTGCYLRISEPVNGSVSRVSDVFNLYLNHGFIRRF